MTPGLMDTAEEIARAYLAILVGALVISGLVHLLVLALS